MKIPDGSNRAARSGKSFRSPLLYRTRLRMAQSRYSFNRNANGVRGVGRGASPASFTRPDGPAVKRANVSRERYSEEMPLSLAYASGYGAPCSDQGLPAQILRTLRSLQPAKSLKLSHSNAR